VEDSYTGPRLIDGKVTSDFMQQLIPYFKEQKVLHRKYVIEVRFVFLQDFGLLACSVITEWAEFGLQMLIKIREFLLKTPSLVDISVPDVRRFI
jgi:PPP5 TPR repeat region